MRKTLTKIFAILAATTLIALPAFTQRDDRLAGVRKMPKGLTVEKARTHIIAPAHTRGIEAEKDVEAEPSIQLKLKKRPRPSIPAGGTPPKLNVTEFANDLNSVLKNSTAGFAMEIRQNGTPIFGLIGGWAQTPNDRSLAWNGNVRMHVASVSKMLTAIGMVKLLDSKGIPLNKEIIGYLPAYWSKGANVNKITFRHLLTHRSGLGVLPAVGGGNSSASDYAFMKQNIALGVPEPGGESHYQNVNFSLMRVLISVINGDIDVDYNPSAQTRDIIWDALTIGYYQDYMQDHVFTPAGVANAGFAPLPVPVNSALGYAFPPGSGWNSGNLETISGGAGWRLSVSEVLNVMNHFRRKGTIMSASRAQDVLDAGLGVDSRSTPAGKMYFKKGAYGNGSGKHEQCMAYYWPDGMEMVIFVNSRVSPVSFSLHKLVRDIYLNSLE